MKTLKNSSIETNLRYLYIDFMRDYIYPIYHKFILHKGKVPFMCGHMNPWYILTPRLFDKQIKNAKHFE